MFRIKIFPDQLKNWIKQDSIRILRLGGRRDKEEGVEIVQNHDRRRPSEVAIELQADEDMILRDYLALDRTVMSNEQSLLSYLRTGLAFAAAGVALFHVNERINTTLSIVGTLLIVVGIILAWTGFARFRRMQIILERVKKLGDSSHSEVEDRLSKES